MIVTLAFSSKLWQKSGSVIPAHSHLRVCGRCAITCRCDYTSFPVRPEYVRLLQNKVQILLLFLFVIIIVVILLRLQHQIKYCHLEQSVSVSFLAAFAYQLLRQMMIGK